MAQLLRAPGRLRAVAALALTPGAQTLLTSIAVACIGALTGVLVARLLGPSSRGALAAIVSWSGFTLGFATLGLDDALTYHGPALLRKAHFDARSLERWIAYTGIGAGVVAAFVVFVLPIEVDHRLWIAITIGFGGGVLVVQNCLVGLVVGLGGYPAWHRARLIGPVVYAVGTASLFLVGEDSLALVVVLVSLSWVTPMIPTYRFARRFLKDRPEAGEHVATAEGPREWRALLGYGLRAQIAKLSTRANMTIDQALLVLFVSTSKLGLYAVAATVATVSPNLLYQAHARLTFSRMRQLSEKRPLERSDAWRSARRALALIVVLQGAIALAAPLGVPLLFGESFRDAGPMASALAVATVPLALSRMLQSWLMAGGHIGSVARAEVVSVGLQVVLIVALSSGPLGVWGAVIASACSYSCSFVLQARLTRRYAREQTQPAAV
jgi:O-antigen/teichoic acid export membrane protein